MKSRIAVVALMGLMVVGTWLTPNLTAQETIDIRLSIQPGDTFTMEMELVQDIAQNVMNQNMDMDQTMGMTMRFDVLDRPSEAGGVWVELTYTRTRFKQQGPMGAMDYDSDNPPANVPMGARGFAGLLDQSILMEYDADGDIVQMEGVDELGQQVIDAMGLPEGPAKQAAEDAVKAQLNEDSLKQMMAMSSAMYPPGPVGVGDSWESTDAVGGMMPMSITSKFTVVEWDDDTVTLDMTGTINPNPDAEPFDMNNAQIDAEMTGTQAGQVVIDRQTGWVRTSDANQDMAGGMSIAGPQGGAMEIDMTIKGTVSLKRVE